MPKVPRTADVARRLVDAYVTSLRQHLPTYCIRQLDKLPGAPEHQLTRLRQSYPGTPTELLYFLQRVNGTCWEPLVAPPGSAPPSASAAASAAAAGGEDAAAAASGGCVSTSTAATATTPLASSSSNTSAEPNKAARTTAAATASATKPSAKATTTAAAASIASEAAAFIKSTLAKKVTGSAARPRRLPHYVALPILGSAYTGCPYYLKSVEHMLLAEQQFPPPSANLPDEGEGWAPPATSATASTPLTTASPPPSATATAAAHEGGLSDAAVAAAGVQLNTNTIASVFAGYKILYGAPPSSDAKASAGTATLTTAAAAGEAGNAAAPTMEVSPSTNPVAAVSDAAAKTQGDEKVVYVDPRIDIHANFYHWLVFADSVQPHVRDPVPTIPDADPAKVAAAAAAAAAPSASAPSNDADKTSAANAAPTAATNTSTATAAAAGTAAKAAVPVKVFAPSRLYIDFKPVELQGGVYGQVIQFMHGQPSSFTVIANDFGSYLKYIMSEEYDFTKELEDDEDDEEDDGETDLVTPKPPKSE